MISLRGVTRRFGQLTAVNRLSLEVAEREVFGLVGPDGAGKTTALRMLCGLLDPDEGELAIAGLDVQRQIDAVKDQIGYMAQKFGLYGDLTVEENMWFYSDLFGVGREERDRMMSEYLEMTRMAEFAAGRPAKLSGGMKQKLALMCTLLHRPRVLLLDEPTNGVDPLSRRDFWNILYRLAEEGMTILVSTAYLDEAERCHRVGLLHQGVMIQCRHSRRTEAPTRAAKFPPGRPRPARGAGAAANEAEVLAAEPAGAYLHVFLEEEGRGEQVRNDTGLLLERLEPSLEDVFIARIRQEERYVQRA